MIGVKEAQAQLLTTENQKEEINLLTLKKLKLKGMELNYIQARGHLYLEYTLVLQSLYPLATNGDASKKAAIDAHIVLVNSERSYEIYIRNFRSKTSYP